MFRSIFLLVCLFAYLSFLMRIEHQHNIFEKKQQLRNRHGIRMSVSPVGRGGAEVRVARRVCKGGEEELKW